MAENLSTISFSFKARNDPKEVERVQTRFAEDYGNLKYDDFRRENENWAIAFRLNLLPGYIFINIDDVPINDILVRPFRFFPESLVVCSYENLWAVMTTQSFQKPYTLYVDETGIDFYFLRKGAVLEMSCNEPLAVDKVFKFDVLQFMNAFARFYESVIVEMLKTYPMLGANKGFINSIPYLSFMDSISEA